MQELYLKVHQTRTSEPTVYENLLGDSIERAFISGITELEDLTQYLVQYGPAPQTAATWTPDYLAAELKRLGDAE